MTPYLGQITLVAFNFAPVGWAICNGSLLSIAQNSALFTLIGTIYGGDGQNTFALPDLRSRIPLHQGQGPGTAPYVMGQNGGSEQVTLLLNQIPSAYSPGSMLHRGEQQPVAGQRRVGSSFEQPTLQGKRGRSGLHGRGGHWLDRRESAASQFDGLPGTQLYHRLGRDLPIAELIVSANGHANSSPRPERMAAATLGRRE